MQHKLVENALKISYGSDSEFKEVVDWLKHIGCQIDEYDKEKGTANVIGLSGIRCGLMHRLDPINSAVLLGFLIAGMYWHIVFPDLLKKINKEFKQRVKRNGR